MVAGSGDNCNSLAGMGVVSAGGGDGVAAVDGDPVRGGGDVMVSLGTSDTLLGVTTDPSPTTTGEQCGALSCATRTAADVYYSGLGPCVSGTTRDGESVSTAQPARVLSSWRVLPLSLAGAQTLARPARPPLTPNGLLLQLSSSGTVLIHLSSLFFSSAPLAHDPWPFLLVALFDELSIPR